ncbi:FeoA family protein [uncultured Sphingomonas sp.]|uniref:FeoA family protein n=1 Tax=uncultured Sphingomonas sp. TaxID=158754 RepID=UPI0025CFF48E|nr:FeoA family protein [uncultured Sphingomonas sp.]
MLSPNLPLSQLPRTCGATVASVDWEGMSPAEARRLREFGLDEGVDIELLHRAMLAGGPLACRIGRMTVALRAHVAVAIRVAPLAG